MQRFTLLALVVQSVSAIPQALSARASNAANSILVTSISSAVASASLKPYATPLASDEIKEWGAYGDSFTAGIGSNGLKDFDSHSQGCSRYKQGTSRSPPIYHDADR